MYFEKLKSRTPHDQYQPSTGLAQSHMTEDCEPDFDFTLTLFLVINDNKNVKLLKRPDRISKECKKGN